MTVTFIAENLLEKDHFLSATEQEGEYIGQPEPGSANEGAMKPVATGDIADLTYHGTTTSNGAVDGTTVIDIELNIFGDDYFIGGTVTITSGAASGQTKSITDFARSTGTITTAAFSAQIVTGVTFTLKVAFATRDFRMALVASGDPGNATFKWSHNGGTTYLGRNDPDQANWLATQTITSNMDAAATLTAIAQLANGDWIVAYEDEVTDDIVVKTSPDQGLTWSDEVSVVDAGLNPVGVAYLLVLRSGRVWLYPGGLYDAYYSDDNGATWAVAKDAQLYGPSFNCAIELSDGRIMALTDESNNIVFAFSSDGGFKWGTTDTANSPTNNDSLNPDGVVCDNGDIVIVMQDDYFDPGNYGIKCLRSEDGGATWSSRIDVMPYVSADLTNPRVAKDINGDLYCVACSGGTNNHIEFCKSVDNGKTWGAIKTLKSTGGTDFEDPFIALMNGHIMVCLFTNTTGDNLKMERRGMWEAFSANACPCAAGALEQKLICDVGVIWHGSKGVSTDSFSFATAYQYAMSNIITDSPSRPWRSTQDNINCAIVIDMGANNRFFADGAGFFGCNVRTLSLQMNGTDSWDSPAVDEAVSFDAAAGVVDSVNGNVIEDTSLLANYKDHQFRADTFFLRMTSGAASGATWKIRDNVAGYLVLDTDSALTGVSASNTFVIFQRHVAKTFNGGLYRFVRINIPAQQTADDYYQLGSVVMGRTVALSFGFGVGYRKPHLYDIRMLRTPGQGMIPVRGAGRRRAFDLTWEASENARQEVLALMDYIQGKNLAFIPNADTLTDCYLVKLVGDIDQVNRNLQRFDMSLRLEENL